MIHIIAAIGKNRELGKNDTLLWHIPDDLKRFKELTMGHPVVMGRKTFDSIVAMLGKPLPGRTNIVVTRDPAWKSDGALRLTSLEDALAHAQTFDPEIFVIGGAQIYEQSLPHADILHVTLVDATDPDADAFFPAFEGIFVAQTEGDLQEQKGIRYRWVDYVRK